MKSVSLDDPGQGISDKVLDQCDVLIWWGHVRQGLIKPDQGKRIVKRIRAGKLSLVALHSAHWPDAIHRSDELTCERGSIGAGSGRGTRQGGVEAAASDPPLYRAPKRSAALTPAASFFRNKDGRYEVNLRLPKLLFSGLPARRQTVDDHHEGPGASDRPRIAEELGRGAHRDVRRALSRSRTRFWWCSKSDGRPVRGSVVG
ncbi:MAG: hypothetical protein CM1200mP2_59510 [Planctomycetaceae bacterium]|nr:MAG: hypothetical protein CM1200mP2_59510 [Planctomycetaceae bacterium]